MGPHDKRLAEAVLRHLLQDAQIDGIRFGPVLQVLITRHGHGRLPVRGQTYLNLGSTWAAFDTLPSSLPDGEADLPEPPQEDQIRALCGLREVRIMGVEIGAEQPHLLMHLEDGRVLFVNGRHESYECWQVGVAFGDPAQCWLVVALPGGEVAVWSPEGFSQAAV